MVTRAAASSIPRARSARAVDGGDESHRPSIHALGGRGAVHRIGVESFRLLGPSTPWWRGASGELVMEAAAFTSSNIFIGAARLTDRWGPPRGQCLADTS